MAEAVPLYHTYHPLPLLTPLNLQLLQAGSPRFHISKFNQNMMNWGSICFRIRGEVPAKNVRNRKAVATSNSGTAGLRVPYTKTRADRGAGQGSSWGPLLWQKAKQGTEPTLLKETLFSQKGYPECNGILKTMPFSIQHCKCSLRKINLKLSFKRYYYQK